MPQSIGTPALWGGFVAFIFLMMAVEIAAIRRNPHDMSMREASTWTAGWITLALLFGAGILWRFGRRPGGHDNSVPARSARRPWSQRAGA